MALLKMIFVIGFFAAAALAKPQLPKEEEPFDPNPKYQYTYEVADDEKKTYITQQESRDGDLVNGQYSYVDPSGTLVTVNYKAGPEGYSEVRNLKEGFLESGKQPIPAPVTPAPAPATPAPAPAGDDLVARIIAKLTPYIQSSVDNAIKNP